MAGIRENDKMAIADDMAAPVISEATPRDYFNLLKPRVMSLVVFTAFVGLYVAPGSINPAIAAIAILAIAIGAGASGALNMWFDADIDAVMGRTAQRPIPAGRVLPREALTFGVILSAFSVVLLGLLVNWLSAALLAFTIFFYAVIYTMWLKRWTPQNIVIGGAAGAIPPVIGWTAVTNSIALEPLVLFLIIFLWTPPHFWALALFKAADYGRAGVPMMPNVAGNRSTQRQILVYSVLLAASGMLPFALGYNGPVYGIAAAVLGILFIRHAWAVDRMDPQDVKMGAAKKLFGYSILYLFALFAVLLAERVVMDLL
jgi:protoheme IX farnesyltransferase